MTKNCKMYRIFKNKNYSNKNKQDLGLFLIWDQVALGCYLYTRFRKLLDPGKETVLHKAPVSKLNFLLPQ